VLDPERLTVLAFDTPAAARVFVHRLARSLDHVAIFIDGEHVIVIDGTEGEPRRREIGRIARGSGGWASVAGPQGIEP
jgi:hypothetical protein